MARASFQSFVRCLPHADTFSKALAEQLVCKVAREEGLPTAILRPSLVSGAAAEPVPGWQEGSGRLLDPVLLGALSVICDAFGV